MPLRGSPAPAEPFSPAFERRTRFARRVSLAIGGVSVLLGLTVLLGWLLHNDALKGAIGTPITMKTNTAVAFVLCGLAVMLLSQQTGPKLRWCVRALAIVIALVGGLVLVEHLAGVDLYIDEALFREPVGEIATASPNRMGPPASSSFLMFGIALLLLPNERTRPIAGSQWLLLLVMFVALFPMIGYAFGSASLYGIAELSGIAWPTSVMLLLLSIGVLAAAPERGLVGLICEEDMGGLMARRALPLGLVAPFVLGWLVAWGTQRGAFDAPLGYATFAGVLIVLLFVLIVHVASTLSRTSRARDAALAQLHEQLAVTRATETALRRSETRRQFALGATGLGFWEVDAATRAFACSEIFKSHFGYDSHETFNEQTLRAGMNEPDQSRWTTAIESCFATGHDVDIELRCEWPDHSIHWIALRGTAVHEGDRICAISGVSVDQTSRRAAEGERAILLESERAARADAERANHLKDDFLATLSHELRTPLNAILGWAHLMRRSLNDPHEMAEGLDVIESSARAQTQLVSDLLDTSRVLSGKLRIAMQDVELATVVEAAVESIRPAADARGVRIEPLLDTTLEPVQGDLTRLQQVVWNLLANAVKFTPRGGKVQIVTRRAEAHAEIVVSDNGQGIDPAFAPHLFERFRQADSSTSREFGGLGLGLSLVKHLVELHGGTVEARSPGLGLGSTFVVQLPIDEPSTREDRSRGQSSGRPLGAHVVLDGVRVLVVDDELYARELVRRLLVDCGAAVSTAAGAREALDLLHREKFDVLVSDLGMPERDGFALMQDLRASGSAVPAAALTAFARPSDRSRALLTGYQAHLAKPVEPVELLATVATLARGASTAQGRPR